MGDSSVMSSRSSAARPWLGAVEVRTLVTDTQRGEACPIDEVQRSGFHWVSDIDGSVEMTVNGRPVLHDVWDEIEPLWESFALLIRGIGAGASYTTVWFPVAHVRFGVAFQHSDMVVVVAQVLGGRRRAVTDRSTFFTALCRAGIDATDELERLGGAPHLAIARKTFLDALDRLYQGEWPTVRVRACSPQIREAEEEARQFFGVHRLAW
jgi:hypothetical protein